MSRKILALSFLLLSGSLWSVSPAHAAPPWRVVIPDTVMIQGDKALLRDVSAVAVPALVGDVVIYAGAAPNTMITVSRQKILRKLVTAGLSSGVAFQGAESCQLVFAGRELNSSALATEIRRELRDLVPPPLAGAPDSWLGWELPSLRLSAAGDWRVQLNRHTPLSPGRNLVQVSVIDGEHREAFSISVVLHSFGETARAIRNIAKDTPLNEAQFKWEWQDLAERSSGVASGRLSLDGASATRSITAGDLLRVADLKDTPLILAGDPVELVVVRGQVAVTVRAVARQQGCLGQTIPVRNELTGRLVNARVAGPGLVEWRR